MAKLVNATDLRNLSGSIGNELLEPIKVGEPPCFQEFEATPSQSKREPLGRCREWTVGT
jgi:hypothetical protein